MFLKKYYLFICTSMLFHISCRDDFSKSSLIDEGVIEYKINYPSLSKDDLLLELLPTKMEMTFKNSNYRNDIVAGMGLFRTSIINNKENEKLIHTLKMLNTKYASNIDTEDLKHINPYFSDIKIQFTKAEKIIAGYNCKEIKVMIGGDSLWSYKAYYTTEINIENPNRNTPFEQVKGVLMDYQLTNYGIHMHFTAHSVYPKEVENSIAELDNDYKMVSPVALRNEIESIFAKIK